MAATLDVNGASHSTPAEPDTPLLYVLRNDLFLAGAKFGCGLGQCGACTVLVDGKAARSCVMPVRQAAGHAITTVEGLNGPISDAFIAEQAAQCGYCTSGMLMSAAALLAEKPHASLDEVKQGLAAN